MEEKKVRKIKAKEIVWYVIASVIAAGGLTLIGIGLTCDFTFNTPLNDSEKVLSSAIKMDYTLLGILILFVGALIAVIALSVFARKVDVSAKTKAKNFIQTQKVESEEVVEVPAEQNK